MKRPYEVTHCKFCDSQITLNSPPSDQRYENAEVYITNGIILLPERLVKGDSHIKDISGYYCRILCFKKMIDSIFISLGE